MDLLERYEILEEGYHPFLIKDGWQVAQLNYNEDQNILNINKLDVHHQTDEVFVLMKGAVVLITANIHNGDVEFKTELMKPGIIYNIPKFTWHNIAMEVGSEVLIVERADTHKFDFDFYYLTDEYRRSLSEEVNKLFTKV